MKKILITFLTLFLIFGLCGCNSNGTPKSQNETLKNQIVGRWVYEEYPRDADHSRHSVDGYWYEFFSDGTYMNGHFIYAEHDPVHFKKDDFYTMWSGTYVITEDGRLKLSPQSETDEIYSISLNGNSLTIDNRLVYKKTN